MQQQLFEKEAQIKGLKNELDYVSRQADLSRQMKTEDHVFGQVQLLQDQLLEATEQVTRQQVRIDQLQQDLSYKNNQIEKLMHEQPNPEPVSNRNAND